MARGGDDFGLAAIVEGNDQGQARIAGRLGLHILNQPHQRRIQAFARTDDPNLDVVADQSLQIGCNKATQKIEYK